jgi:NAD+ kinase
MGMNTPIRRVGLVAKHNLDASAGVLAELAGWLEARGVEPVFETHTAALVGLPPGRPTKSPDDLPNSCDLVVVLGGDGTLIGMAGKIAQAGTSVPILGVNFGSLGFLTEITMPELYPTLEGVLHGDSKFEERRMLHARVQQPDAADTTGDVLNDVVVTKAALSRIIEFDVAIDGLFVSAFRADGLIVSSPTGSTAYNLAAGGPILHPTLEAVVLTPICPHMLSNRPLVVSDRSSIEVRLRAGRESDAHLTLDGQRGFPLRGGDVVTVTRSPRTIRLVKAQRDYFEVLRTKLKWGESTPQKSG